MIDPRVIPVLLLADGRLVKTVKFREPNYVGDPINILNIFSTLGADEIVLLDILATREGRGPDLVQLRRIAQEAQVPLAYGGGIQNVEDVRAVLRAGAEKCVMNTSAGEGDIISAAADLAGSQAVVASIDVGVDKDGKSRVFIRNGTCMLDVDPVTYAREMERKGAGEIFLVSIDRDGTFGGYDLDLIRSVCRAVRVPVIACGGAGSRAHLRAAISDGGASAAAAGSIFVYQKRNRSVVVNFPPRAELRKIIA